MAKKPKDKPRKQKLKVFVTPIGFHDAYVAAPSRKAALEAWGADANIFAQGIAEEVTDPNPGSSPGLRQAIEDALAHPGEVIRRVRGSAEEHVKALGKGAKKKSTSPRSPAASRPLPRERGKKPSRAELDAAEEALEKADRKQRKKLREVDDRIRELERKRRELERRHEAGRDELSEKRDRARSAYERAMREWKR